MKRVLLSSLNGPYPQVRLWWRSPTGRICVQFPQIWHLVQALWLLVPGMIISVLNLPVNIISAVHQTTNYNLKYGEKSRKVRNIAQSRQMSRNVARAMNIEDFCPCRQTQFYALYILLVTKFKHYKVLKLWCIVFLRSTFFQVTQFSLETVSTYLFESHTLLLLRWYCYKVEQSDMFHWALCNTDRNTYAGC